MYPPFDSLGVIVDKPKQRQYCTIQSRIESFKNWPSNKTQTKEALAEAGFAYTGTDDCVRCFHCTIGLKDWPEDACPWEQHVLANPKCGHVILSKGKVFVKNILCEELSDSDVEDTQNVVDTVKQAIERNTKAVTAARELFRDEELIITAVKALINYDVSKKFTALELLKAIEEIAENHSESNETPGGDSSVTEDAVIETNKKLKERITCKICFATIVSIITLPCGHLVTCSQCTSAVSKCVTCGVKIKGRIRAVLAY